MLVDEGVLKPGEGAEIQAEISKDIEDALTWAEAQPYATAEATYEDVFAPGTFGGYSRERGQGRRPRRSRRRDRRRTR